MNNWAKHLRLSADELIKEGLLTYAAEFRIAADQIDALTKDWRHAFDRAIELQNENREQVTRIAILELALDRMVSVFGVPSNETLPGAEQETINYAKRVRTGGYR